MEYLKAYRFFSVVMLFVTLGVVGVMVYYQYVDTITAMIIAIPALIFGYFYGAVIELNKRK